ncbi:carbohydrate ABC transporter permease [Paenibacillus alginolyticus]|uniref:Carbohydrate ABC transporter permease n=1 Tax=Paenibacillus alginolyticus TaxID=59839 RepID=A0ABT4G5G5_9BACL|nr:carbohydrate ABC transporter permease [Paenibacillus alginolyticus]MCY9691406.1 carbohydrate ABC transporter permease [Paenibacillus alginolyticus]MEC0146514.1 carbohydrate ABC transporter permease [Paenibacillus alginolyticus]
MSNLAISVRQKKKRSQEQIRKTIAYLFLIIGSFVMAIPFLWMLSTSLKEQGVVFDMPPKWIPEHFEWSNYVFVLTEANVLKGFMNTMLVISLPCVIGLFTSALAANAFARLSFPAKNVLFMMLLATMMIPGVVTMIPTFILYKNIGWVDSWMPLIIPGMFGAAAAVFFLRQFFMTIPMELEDAAKMDGLNPFQIFIQIMLPLSKPALVTQGIFGFLAGYNDFLGPLIYINSPEKFTLQLVLASFQGFYNAQWTYIMAGAVLALIPTILLFFFAQRYFVEGITMTGMKG